MPPVSGHRYLASTAIFLSELLKLSVCTSLALYQLSRTLPPSAPATQLFSRLAAAVFTGDSWKLAVPASLYTLQSSLQYLAVAHLDAATLQVTYQFKILPTALFSIALLGRRLGARQWAALALLMLGVAVVQIPGAQQAAHAVASAPVRESHAGSYVPRSLDAWARHGVAKAAVEGALDRRSATYEGIEEDLLRENPARSSMLGLAAALGACVASALGSVYFEKVLKEEVAAPNGGGGTQGGGGAGRVSIWVRNVQLSVYALFPAFFIGIVFVDGEAVARAGFLAGYNDVVWTVVACQALGGILVALCVHHADNIAKSFATSFSILLSLCASVVLFDFSMTRYVRRPFRALPHSRTPPAPAKADPLPAAVPPRHQPRPARDVPLQRARRRAARARPRAAPAHPRR